VPFDGNNLTVAPSSRELEVSVFGPGFGECIALHLGDGNWAVVDSCLDAGSKQPASLTYLDLIGANPAKSIQLVVATHWHDDHMDGISKVFQTASDAIFACTSAVQQADFQEVLASWTGTRFLPGGSGVDELRSIMAELKKRSTDARCVAPKLAGVGRALWPIASKPNPLAMSIKCLSPSDAAVLATIARLKGVAPASTKIRRRLPNLKENDTSVVLSIEVKGHRVLLGGDLHVRADRALGWLAIVDDHAGADSKHHAFKVPHHGSPTGDHAEVWNDLTVEQNFAVTTPFVGGSTRLPSLADCQRILTKTQNAYLSAPPLPGKFRDSNKTVERMVQEATRSIQSVPGKYGHVRLRKHVDEKPGTPWRVELFGSAVRIVDYVEATPE
jgi:hypothetical protein